MNPSQEFKKLYHRDLEKLKQEIVAYQNESDLWIVRGDIKNSAGNLAMHLCGNLQHFIGTVLANTGYQRDREFEFSGQLSQAAIVNEIDATIKALDDYFDQVPVSDYEKEYPLEVFGSKMTNFYFISHLLGHLNYHLGQINYHRRIFTN